MIALEVIGIIAVFAAVIFFVTNFLDKHAKRRIVALGIVAIAAFALNVGAMVYDAVQEGSKNAFDYVITLVRGVQNTASLLVFDDQFSTLGILTQYTWFKALYYSVLGIAYFLYSLTLISLISYKLVCRFKIFFGRKKQAFAFICLNDKSLMLAASVKREHPDCPVIFALNEFTQTDSDKKQLRKLKNERYLLYVGGKNTDGKSFFSRFPLLGKYKKLSVFCLDDNSEKNISFCKNFSGDPIEIYALTDEEFCGSLYLKKSNVHTVKQHDLTARMLVTGHPCHATAYDTDKGKEINALILGRGRSGNEIFKNIYIANQFENIRLNVTLFDEKDKNGFYRLQYPGIYESGNVKFVQANIYSANFISELADYIKPNNYIVVSLGDDKRNIEIANLLYDFILTKTDKKAEIYAHVRYERNKTLLKSETEDGICVKAFGHESQVFDYQIVVAEFIDIIAKAVNDNYNAGNPDNAVKWQDLSEFTKSSNRAVGLAFNAKMFSLGLEIADLSDPREEADLFSLPPEDDLRAAKEEHRRWCAFHLVNGWTAMTIEESKALSAGKKVRKSEKKKRSLSLVDWDGLREVSEYLGEDVQSYDYLWKSAAVAALHAVGKKPVRKT